MDLFLAVRMIILNVPQHDGESMVVLSRNILTVSTGAALQKEANGDRKGPYPSFLQAVFS